MTRGQPGEWSLAIDFGTSFTVVATEVAGRVEILEINNSRYVPSTVCLDQDGSLLVGQEAVGEAAVDPTRTERLPKRAMAAADHVRLADRTVGTVELVSAVLAHVSAEALRQRAGRPPARVILTHPARWQQGGTELRRLVRAAELAGLLGPELVSEPVAAAHHYVDVSSDTGDVPVGGTIGIYDLGGGTFDTAVLRRGSRGFELAGPPGGDPHLGGEDLDAELMDIVGSYAEAEAPDQWSALWEAQGVGAERNRSFLREEVTRRKHALSTRATVNVHVPGFDDELRITRGEYEKAIDDILRRSVREMAATIHRAGATPETLGDLYLTGGSSRTPRVSTVLAEELALLPVMVDDPKAVVVRGALATPRDGSRPRDVLQEIAAELTAIAAAVGVGDVVGPVPAERRRLGDAVDALARAIGTRCSPFPGLPPEVAIQVLREGRHELGALGDALTRLDRVVARLDASHPPRRSR